jgi:hypothetical protein
MGSEYSCQTVQSEEETVNKIFKDMFKKEIQTRSLYDFYINCIIYHPDLKNLELDKKLFSSFLNYFLEDNPYVDFYKEYFNNIIYSHSEIESIRKIGLIIIENTMANYQANLRKSFYIQHFEKFYLENISDKSEKNSIKLSNVFGKSNSLNFNTNYENKNPNIELPYYKKPNSAELDNDKRYFLNEYHQNIADIKKTNSNDSLKIKVNKKINSADLGNFNYDFNSSNFNFNVKQNPNFISFIKKKELEDLDNKIITFISDVIENNTNCLSYALKNIFSENCLETLEKSWSKNNKKLLLFEIHRNYTSLVKKICLYPTNNIDDIFKKKSYKHNYSYQFNNNIISPRNNSSKNINIDNFNNKFEIERAISEDDNNKKKNLKK